jgi:two-component system response regulator YesN
MPEMTGTDLLMILHERGISPEVIVLSGHSDFEAAQTMLKTGNVTQYLLKPVSEDIAVEAVAQAIANIEEKRELAAMKGRLSAVVENQKRRLFHAKVFGYSYEEETPAQLGEEYATIQVAVVYKETGDAALKEFCADMLTYNLSHLRYIYPCDTHGYYALLFASGQDNIQKETLNVCSYICEKTGSVCGVGRQYNELDDINTSYQQALFACESRIFIAKPVIEADSIQTGLRDYINRDAMIEKMTLYVRGGDMQKIDNLLKMIFKSYFYELAKDAASKMYDLSVTKAYFAYFLESILPKDKSSINLSNLFTVNNMEQLFEIVRNMLHQGCEYYSQDKISHKRKLIAEVKKFIDENYHKQITLSDAADVVFINPSYLSRLFSEVDGGVFTDYVAKVRIEAAKKLLVDRKYKVYEIAEKVGYRSFKYFLRVFKEREGITPAQYRAKHIFT